MAENKTQATEASVEAYLAERASAAQRQDCDALVALLSRLTGEPAVMWGPSIVGFGRYRYRYDSGREGEMCLYFKRLADLDVPVLEALVAASIAETRRRYG